MRGTKGSLLEGGTKVDAFVYSPLLEARSKGASYPNLMHVTDWFPTIVDMAGAGGRYASRVGYELDGVSHLAAWAAVGTAPEAATSTAAAAAAPRLQVGDE